MNHIELRGSDDLTPFVAFAPQSMVPELQAVYDELLQQVTIP